MRKTIILGDISDSGLQKKYATTRSFYTTDKLSSAFIYHLDNLEIDSYILDCNTFNLEQIRSFTEQISNLNSRICILIFDPSNRIQSEINSSDNVHIIDKLDQFDSYFDSIAKNNRVFNRVQWPLKVIFHGSNKKEIKHNGLVLSLSVGGCFIKLENELETLNEDKIILTFYFKDFDFLVEGSIKRLKHNKLDKITNIAIEFEKISPTTTQYLKEIIDKEILSEVID